MRTTDDGVAAVEVAILLPMFLLLTFGAIDFGLAFRQQLILRGAASSAAEFASTRPCDNAGIVGAATNEVQNVSVLKPEPSLSPGPDPVFLDQAGVAAGDCNTAYQLRVTVSAPYTLLTGTFLHAFLPAVPTVVNVSGQETVRIKGR